MKNLPPFDPEKARVLKKLAENPCATLTECDEQILGNRNHGLNSKIHTTSETEVSTTQFPWFVIRKILVGIDATTVSKEFASGIPAGNIGRR